MRDLTPYPDIASRADIVCLVDRFYGHVRDDDILGPIFDEVARVDWASHLPRMYDFWEAVLFGSAAFKGNPLAVHQELALRTPLTSREFGRWLQLFHATIDDLFRGACADDAKMRSARIASVMHYHVGSAV